ncbi:MAG: alpha-(1-_3)-arabinofuranosyltransferase family protein [Patescibacteria group bacterium]|nr:alpha-(1->3)-arabinofuranosyltransferase family protein [Patescibacteria group bacterium]
MKKISKRKIFEIIVVLILGLIPLLWFHKNEVILGHDSGLTLFPLPHFLDRLSIWTERFGFGHDQNYALAGFFIHGLEALVSFLGFKLQNFQKIVFVFWFVLPGLTMLYFSSKLEKRLGLKYFALPATLLYMINHFLLQGWLIVERTKFSIYAALPLVMAFLFDWEDKKRSTLKTSILISITLFFLNGEASIPLFGGFIVSIIVFIFFYLYQDFSKRRIFNLFKLSISTLVVSAFINAYWLLPYGSYVLNSYSAAVTQAGGVSGVLGWIDYISRYSSLINLLRLQGVPEWYQNSYHPYSSIFLNNPIIIGISYLIPLGAFLGLLLIKDKKTRKMILFFAVLALLSMVFVGGSHPPFGPLYTFLVSYVPGFIAFRTPFYKFAPALWFSYSVLIGFTISYFLSSLSIKRKTLSNVLLIVFCASVVLYSFPFLNGLFFDYMKPERTMKVNVPQYIYDFGKWSDSKDRINVRTLALPEPNWNIDAYYWGFWSSQSLTSLLTNAQIINENGYMSKDEMVLIQSLHNMMKRNDPGWEKFAKFLGFKSFLLRKDFNWNLSGLTTDPPSMYEAALKSPNLNLVKKFGDWEVYDFKDTNDVQTKIEVTKGISYFPNKIKNLYLLFSTQSVANPKEPIFVPEQESKFENEALKQTNAVYLVSDCVTCDLQRTFVNTGAYLPLLIRDSVFYPIVEFFEKNAEKKVLSTLQKREDKPKFYLYKSLEKLMAVDKGTLLKREVSTITGLFNDYSQTLEKLDLSLNEYFSDQQNIDNDFLVEAFDVLKTERNAYVAIAMRTFEDSRPGGYQPQLLDAVYNQIVKNFASVGNNVWQSTEESKKRFLLSVPLEREYHFIYKPNDQNYTLPGEVNFSIDGKKYSARPEIQSPGWYSLGKYSLPKGNHKFEIEQQSVNLYDGSREFLIAPRLDSLCWVFDKKITGMKDDIFRVTFQHIRLAGSDNLGLSVNYLSGVQQYNGNPFYKSGEAIYPTYNLVNYIYDLVLTENNQNVTFSICGFPSTDETRVSPVVRIEGLNIRKLDIPDLIAYGASANDLTEPVNYTYDKKTSTSYNLNTSAGENDEYAVVLNESFSDNWKINGVGNNRFKANGYANGWIMNGPQKNKEIKYLPQDYVNLGFRITLISLVLTVLAYGVLKLKKL